ncbi:MAG TPA: hypothetical protein ENI17_00515 [Pseudomonas xinjiangensis]|uniref:Dicarboxylate transport n=2 Tax=root TaxID=1 RepID=A0A7V1FRH7_9GAMM|nr:hypothetical protein [Halopseudomonas xinjiangensis]HEC46105.1 hypothetical protein [Halopseudomonas xinjiangensis]
MRTAFRILIVVVALLMLAGFFAVQTAQRMLLEAGVEQLEWQGVRWSGRELSVAQVTGLYNAGQGQMQFSVKDLRVALIWRSGPKLQVLNIGELDMDWEPEDAPVNQQPGAGLGDSASGAPPDADAELHKETDPADWFSALTWLPHRMAVESFQLGVPCQDQRCTLVGHASLRHSPETGRVTAEINLQADGQTLVWTTDLNRAAGRVELNSEVEVADSPALQLHHLWSGTGKAMRWEGRLTVPGWPPSDWLLTLIEPWLNPGALPFDRLPEGGKIDAQWSLVPGKPPDKLLDLLEGTVALNARISLPRPWPLRQIGHVQGAASIELEGNQGQWLLRQGAGQIRIEQPTLALLDDMPADLRPVALTVEVQPDPVTQLSWLNSIPLGLHASVEGPVDAEIQARLNVISRPAWQIQLEQGGVTISSQQLELAGTVLTGFRLVWPLEGLLTRQRLELTLGQAALVTVDELSDQALGLHGEEVRLALPGLTLDLPLDDPAGVQIESEMQLTASALAHAMLRTQGWTVNGQLKQGPASLTWAGSVANAGGLALDADFAWPHEQAWQAEITLQEMFLRATNPLAATFSAWPALLSLGTGRVGGRFEVSGGPALDELTGRVQVAGVAGIYDRATFEGLTFALLINLRNDQLTLTTPGLDVAALDTGIPIGPVRFSGAYRGSVNDFANGSLDIERASMALLGGQLSLEPGVLDLGETTLDLTVAMEGLELASLFEIYPAQGLSGRGTLDGRLPVSLTDGTLQIEGGAVQARQPGGVLQYRSQKLTELAQSNPGMREVALALDDFRYTVLSSEVDYGEEGMLILGLRLEGSNPDLQKGRPVHFNIRLEEDIPALLASLQLSGQVSDIIQKRVQERLLQRRLKP